MKRAIGVLNGNHRGGYRTDVSESAALEHERDLNALYNDLSILTDDDTAAQFCFTLTGKEYGDKCAALVAEIERVYGALSVIKVAAMVNLVDDTDPQKEAVDAWEFLSQRQMEISEEISKLFVESGEILTWKDAYLAKNLPPVSQGAASVRGLVEIARRKGIRVIGNPPPEKAFNINDLNSD
jgi:hypothetical protein